MQLVVSSLAVSLCLSVTSLRLMYVHRVSMNSSTQIITNYKLQITFTTNRKLLQCTVTSRTP